MAFYLPQEFVWKRSASQSVRKYEFRIKKDEEKALVFTVDDDDRINDVYCRDEVSFKAPFQLEDRVEYKINIYR